MKTNMKSNKIELFILTIISIGFILWSAAFIYETSSIAVDGKRYFCLFDDAMISMRYAWNFSHGLGLVWNPGEYVEGYTNLLMVLIMSVTTLIFDKLAAVLCIQIMNIGFLLAIAYLSLKISDIVFSASNDLQRSLVKILSFSFSLGYYPLAYWSLMGMETGLLTLLLLAGILSALKYTKNRKPILLPLTAIYLGLAFLTRNDSAIFSVLIWLYIISETRKAKSAENGHRQLLTSVGLFLLFIIGQELFRYFYYGELLPNTYTLKLTGIPLLIRLRGGIGFILPFLKITIPILIVPTFDLLFNFRKQNFLLLSIAFSAIAYQVYVGGDPWVYWRIMAPIIPITLILFIIAINAIVGIVSNTQTFSNYIIRSPIVPKKYAASFLVVPLVLAGLIYANTDFFKEIFFIDEPYQAPSNLRNINVAIALEQVTTSDASVGVFWAGSIPYYSGRTAIDFLGKSDPYIAHLSADISGNASWSGMQSVPGHNKYDLNYSIGIREPTYVQAFAWGSQNLAQLAEARYVTVFYNGVELHLLRDSPDVLWDRLDLP